MPLHRFLFVRLEPIRARVPVFSEFACDASCHHERRDGKGYYRGVVAESLSVPARIMATADVFDAMSATRPYRGPLPLEQVMTIMLEGRGTHFCPATLDALVASPYASGTAGGLILIFRDTHPNTSSRTRSCS